MKIKRCDGNFEGCILRIIYACTFIVDINVVVIMFHVKFINKIRYESVYLFATQFRLSNVRWLDIP